MSDENDLPQRDRWARLRFAIIGPLLAAPPVAGELHEALTALAARAWRHPFTGLEVRFGCSTLERWYYAAKRAGDPVQALRNQVRGDIGRFPSLSAEAVQALTTQYREHPGWTAQLHYDNLRVMLAAAGTKCPSYPSVRRYLKAHGLLRQRPLRRVSEGALAARDRLEQREVRSYEVEHVLQLMHLDFHHGSRKVLTRGGQYVKPLLVGFIDDRSRFLCHAQWYTSEGTEELVHGLSQALQKVGLPRSLMTDRGSAMISGEFTAGLHHLGILHLPTLPYSPHVVRRTRVLSFSVAICAKPDHPGYVAGILTEVLRSTPLRRSIESGPPGRRQQRGVRQQGFPIGNFRLLGHPAAGSCGLRGSLRNSAAKARDFGSRLPRARATSVTRRAMRPV